MNRPEKVVLGFWFRRSPAAAFGQLADGAASWVATNTHANTHIRLSSGACFQAEVKVWTGRGSSVVFVGYNHHSYAGALNNALEQARRFGRGLR